MIGTIAGDIMGARFEFKINKEKYPPLRRVFFFIN